ncbi:MAG: DUF4145 domain-containing protein [Candidatus Lustribacter sp.]
MATWTCPYCRQRAAVGTGCTRTTKDLRLPTSHEAVLVATACLNPDCRKVELIVNLYEWKAGEYTGGANDGVRDRLVRRWNLIPESRARTWPEYVPAAIRADYVEACKTEPVSPRASAAFSRRCIRAILRDFYQIEERRLVDEIAALKDNVEEPVSEALHALHQIGSIAAHPESAPDAIVDVDPSEAAALIELTELLILETYVATERRRTTRKRAQAIADETGKTKA